ncbi:Hypothetical predicted protein [Lecanosticta acicola]|uniref:EF-hand domain-containing protein n=1 Tax=Lecanosticta acicola TaxID=111012 RepID=A0AAI9E9J7_9PEZI|nr:Hypothetical predicted protein [Lecanosticta acicola]
MKFLATLAVALLPMTALARVIATPGLPGINATIDIDGDGDIDLTALGGPINVIEVLFDLLKSGKIDLVDPASHQTAACEESDKSSSSTAVGLVKRAKVPGLHCGYSRAASCAFSAGSLVATCVWAAIGRGKDVKEDTKCMGAISSMGANLPSNCRKCFGLPDY